MPLYGFYTLTTSLVVNLKMLFTHAMGMLHAQHTARNSNMTDLVKLLSQAFISLTVRTSHL